MVYQTDNIVKDVRVCMDQNMATDSLFTSGDIDTLMLDEIIRSKILEAVERVESMAPYYLLEEGHNFETDSSEHVPISWKTGDTCGWVLVPDDFMRLIVFEMSDWERPVYEVITPADAAYKLQRSRIKALRGNVQRPVVALVSMPTGKALEFYSCKDQTAYVTKAMYVPHPSITDSSIDFSEQCYDSIVYMISGLVLATIGDSDKSASMIELSKSYLEK